ncbi:HTH domain protein [Natrialba magadii ATCC 43099]|uniref:HTH domain protein n=1 Tax=Natrialba magadii (strain ATCC 43099 / DSM 3394 / CCM 3739 / CIP 104546 / IAM 13178 / JCM 8861 / NBRC 102185 / NCIMB 2190 / MS3) TaxID=547559 RepID=D3SW67_NATMM|nr:HTH domain protein [Natrialba magadii ATCC 43099]ELY29859.1 hypothetical protein C500_09614 [Natrialba magadii ATCC 43099]
MGYGVVLAELFASSARYEILRKLTQSPKTVSELEETVNTTRRTVLRNLNHSKKKGGFDSQMIGFTLCLS